MAAGVGQAEGHVRRRLVQHREATGLVVFVVQLGFAGGRGVEALGRRAIDRRQVAVAFVDIGGDTNGQLVGQRHVDHGLQAAGVVIAVFHRGAGVIAIQARLVGDDIDGAAGRGLAVEGAGRAAQHFDALHVEEGQALLDRTAVIDAVDIEGDALFALGGRIRRGDAADIGRDAELVAGNIDAGGDVLDVVDLGDALALQVIAADGVDGGRHGQGRLRTLESCDDDDGRVGIGRLRGGSVGGGLRLGVSRQRQKTGARQV